MHWMWQGFQTQTSFNRAQATSQRREAIPVSQVPQEVLPQWFLLPAHQPQILLLQTCSNHTLLRQYHSLSTHNHTSTTDTTTGVVLLNVWFLITCSLSTPFSDFTTPTPLQTIPQTPLKENILKPKIFCQDKSDQNGYKGPPYFQNRRCDFSKIELNSM